MSLGRWRQRSSGRSGTMEHSLRLPLKEVLPIIQDRIMTSTTYFGVPALQNPLDYWVYQEILFEVRPDVVVEIGTRCGGTTLALAHLCDALGSGRVVGVDQTLEAVPEIVRSHPRIDLIEGDACASYPAVASLIAEGARVVIIEDSSHECHQTLEVLRSYCSLVGRGSYFIVEDGICHHGLNVGPKPGPYEAVEAFLAENASFEADRSRESFLITWNPKGFLRRIG